MFLTEVAFETSSLIFFKSLIVNFAINRFLSDTEAEIQIVIDKCESLGVKAILCNVWGEGGKGAVDLAKAVVEVVDNTTKKFKPIYDWNWSVEKKIETIAKKIYGADSVDYSTKAKADLRKIKRLGLENLPVCIAKTQKSFSDNPKLLGRPKGFVVTVREIEIAVGANFLVPITGNMMRMPGLPATPSAEFIDIDKDGNISGLS